MDEELYSLIRKLRDESTFVQAEKRQLVEQFRALLKRAEQLFHKQWIVTKQHLILDDLILGRNKLTTSQCCTKFGLLANKSQFVESHKVLGYNDYQVAEFLKALRERPALLAPLLVRSERYSGSAGLAIGDQQQLFSAQQLVPIVFQSLYGNCVLIQDEVLCLQLLKHVMDLQFGGSGGAGVESSPAVDLRRLIRKQSCSFNVLFKFYISFSFSAQLFLTAALYDPISQMLTQEWYLDIDPDKALGRFTSDEFTRRFGQANTKEHKLKIQRYREKIVGQLYSATMSFIDSINANLFCFPTPLAWLVNQLYQLVNRDSKSSAQTDTSRKLCCDLIMALYICPAICDPEPYGVISDIQMSVYARHNLMQIANILQVLAMSDDDKDPKAQDLYSKFRNNCVSDILNNIILTQNTRSAGAGLASLSDAQTLSEQSNDPSQADLSAMFSSNPSYLSNDLQASLTRASVMISASDLHRLLIYCRQVSRDAAAQELEEVKWLKGVLPADYINQALEHGAQVLNSAQVPRHSSLTLTNGGGGGGGGPLVPASTLPRGSLTATTFTPESVEVVLSIVKEPALESIEGAQVLVIAINDKGLTCPGMLSEEKVLSEVEASASASSSHLFHKGGQRLTTGVKSGHRGDLSSTKGGGGGGKVAKTVKRHQIDDNDPPFAAAGAGVIGGASSVKIRSCLSSDAGGEGVSEEVCETNECRSISSSDDDDDEDAANANGDVNVLEEADDGLSDFSGNFSGRDTPIISGRDTPSSHSHEDLQNTSSSRHVISANNAAGNSSTNLNEPASSGNTVNTGVVGIASSSMNPMRGPQLPITVQKANREDINDKFCKFEINKINAPVKEEQLSEAWSLDADPPESVNNEPINELLMDENSSNSVAAHLQGPGMGTGRALNPPMIRTLSNAAPAVTAAPVPATGNLISFGGDQEPMITGSVSAKSATLTHANSEADGNLDDRCSVVSDSAAWSTDLINNSDSDLESNSSPSKYTPYSTYSSNSSSHAAANQHASIINNSNLMPVDLAASAQSTAVFLLNQNATATGSPSIGAQNDLIKASLKSVDSGLNSWSYSDSTTSGLPLGSAGLDPVKSSPSPATAVTANSPTSAGSSSSSNKHRLTSIFSSSNSGGVKFSLAGSSNSNSQPKRGGLHRIFNIKPSSKSPANDPFASIAPNLSAATPTSAGGGGGETTDNIDSILKKYANKTATPPAPPPPAGPSVGTLIDLSTPPPVPAPALAASQSTSSMLMAGETASSLAKNFSMNSLQAEPAAESLFYDAANVEQSKLFLDAKKKLRLVLSWSDCCNFNFMPMNHYKNPKENFLTMYLKTQLYEAIGLQDKEKEAQLYETIRCISAFTNQDCHKLLRSLRKDYLKRVSYMTYLTKSKQSVLYSLNLCDKLVQRSEWHQKLCTHHLASVVTRIFLEAKEHESTVFAFVQGFRQLVVVDEKFDLFKKCLQTLYADFDAIWNGCDDEMLQLGHLYMERLLMSKVYTFAMYPNGEIDHYRDSKVSECFAELANVITPSHPLIGIAPIYHQECPWTAAQMELRRLNIYKTPKDKLACIHKCLLTIQNLLAIAKSPVCADDLHPVLIYVIIKANPPTFLSNVQYIEGFYGSQLESEDYYWAQFIFAFSYIKAKMLNKVTSGPQSSNPV